MLRIAEFLETSLGMYQGNGPNVLRLDANLGRRDNIAIGDKMSQVPAGITILESKIERE